jgi:quercetin dioxygenase-like cupin family protein
MMRPAIDPSDETIRLGPLVVRFLITGKDSNESVAIFELGVPGAQRLEAPAHSHDHYEETVHGIDGVLTWTVDGKEFQVGPGQALCIPRGAVHRFDNRGTEDVKTLCVITLRQVARRTAPGWPRSCAAMASRRLRLLPGRSPPHPSEQAYHPDYVSRMELSMDKKQLIQALNEDLAEEFGDKGLVVQLEDMVRDESGHAEGTERICATGRSEPYHRRLSDDPQLPSRHSHQSSTRRPFTRERCLMFRVATVRSCRRAVAAMRTSSVPMGSPRLSRSARISPASNASDGLRGRMTTRESTSLRSRFQSPFPRGWRTTPNRSSMRQTTEV